jgi:N-acetylmuramoyl-L-alanine amidase
VRFTRSRRTAVAGLLVVVTTAAGCSSGTSVPPPTTPPPPRTSSTPNPPVAIATTPRATEHPHPSTHSRTPSTPSTSSTSTPTVTPTPSSSTPTAAPHHRPVVVIDPGHSVSVHGVDPATGLDTSDYENEPEMRDVYAVALLVRQQLVAAGYRVLLTKTSVDAPTNLGQRAYLANRVHADLALSIHDQAGANGGIPFASGNNHVYYQAVGDYRENPQGKKIYFTDARLAAISKRYGEKFVQQRIHAQGTAVNLMSNTGYDLGGRGLQSGNIWIVQLLSHVPWIYNEAGGNSAGMVGLSAHDKQVYADGLVAGVEACLPLHR